MKLAPAVSALLLSCSSASLRGASSVERDKEPAVRATTTLRAAACRDGSGAPVAPLPLEFGVLEPTRGPKLLIERRAGHDSVVIQNSYDDAGTRVFAYVSDDADNPPLLHRIRLENAARTGDLAVSRTFRTRDTPQGFRVEAERGVLRCTLEPLQGNADAAHGDASR